jgi:sugar-specific transcriptional regulator TrmB
MKKDLLKRAGLSENEAACYQLLLDKGAATPPEVSLALGLTRQNAYAVLKSLDALGLAEPDDRYKKLRYHPESPERLIEICDEKIKKVEHSKDYLEHYLPDLMGFYKLARNKPGISSFRGVEGIQALYEDALRRGVNEIQMILSEKGKSAYLSAWIVRHFRPQRLKKKIALREIITTPESHKPGELEKLLWQKKYIEMPTMPRDMDILIYDDNVTFISYAKKEPVGFTIDDKLVYGAIRSLFETLWYI